MSKPVKYLLCRGNIGLWVCKSKLTPSSKEFVVTGGDTPDEAIRRNDWARARLTMITDHMAGRCKPEECDDCVRCPDGTSRGVLKDLV